MADRCIVCGSATWSSLAEPHPNRCVRTDGTTEWYPLRKHQCKNCGLGYRMSSGDLCKVYSEEYSLYANRPGADAFNRQRHPTLASLIAKAVGPLQPARILEVGCGDGSTLSAVRAVWPAAETVGLEPSYSAAHLARAAGHIVVQGMATPAIPLEIPGTFDLIFSIQVIEHTADPVAFLKAQASRLTPDGVVVAVCPNGAVPHAELIHPDHLFSFTPCHLAVVAENAELAYRRGWEFTLDEAHEYNQVLVGGRANGASDHRTATGTTASQDEVARLERGRNEYLSRWARLESQLLERVGRSERVACFGTGGWAANLAGYAPAVWERIFGCTVDGCPAERFLDKPVVSYEDLHEHMPDAVIVAVNPARQNVLYDRLSRDGFTAIRWNDLIDR